jgi:hypothetical protein
MGKLLRNGFAILIAYWVVAPGRVAAHFDTPRFHAVQAELAAERPAEKLWDDVKTWVGGAQK